MERIHINQMCLFIHKNLIQTFSGLISALEFYNRMTHVEHCTIEVNKTSTTYVFGEKK